MSKTVRERKLDSPAARAKLKTSGKPYWRAIDTGLHLGYRKGLASGKWVLRRYLGDEKYSVETIGIADDHSAADGDDILDFFQAQRKARDITAASRRPGLVDAELTVRFAADSYYKIRGIGQNRLAKYVLSDAIVDQPLSALTEAALEGWHNRLPKTLAPASVKRITSDFRAALNCAAKSHRTRLPADLPIIIRHGLASSVSVAAVARDAQILPDADVRRLIDAAWAVDTSDGWDGDLARLIIVLAATGARFSQIARMKVGDVQGRGRLMVPVSRKGRGTKSAELIAARVGEDVISALAPAIAGRKGPDALFERWHWRRIEGGNYIKERRGPWSWASELTRPWIKILHHAGLPTDIVPYALRHSSIVRGLRVGLPVRLVAALHDTSSIMIEKHYSAYVVDAMDELAAKAIIPLTSAPISNIRPVEQARG
jgi:integrase